MKLTNLEIYNELLCYYDDIFINEKTDSELLDIFNKIVEENSIEINVPNIIEKYENDYILIDTPDGYNELLDIIIKERKCIIITCDDDILECSIDHLIETNIGWKKALDIDNELILTKHGFKKITNKEFIEYQEVYDIEISHDKHRYWSSNISSHNTSKTFTECYYAIQSLKNHTFDKIMLTKPIKEAGEELGFLPGDVAAKIDPHYESFKNNFEKIIKPANFQRLIEKNIILCKPLAYLRGTGFDKHLMILDEAQNVKLSQLMLFITRMGKDSKVIISGDIRQHDIAKNKVALPFLEEKILSGTKRVGVFQFTDDDNMRHPIIQEITKRYEELKEADEIPKNL